MQLLFFYLKPTSLKPHLLSRKIKYRLSVQSIPFKWQRTSHRSSSHEVSLAFLFYCLLTASREHKTGSEHVSPRIGLPGMQPLPWWVLSCHPPALFGAMGASRTTHREWAIQSEAQRKARARANGRDHREGKTLTGHIIIRVMHPFT